jgi:hypothetical protein
MTSSHILLYWNVHEEPTEEGIGTVDEVESESTEEQVKYSIFDKNVEILEFERRAFDGVEGIESDIE